MTSENVAAQANVKSQNRVSAIWVLPVVALVIGAWMLFQYINSTGPEITIKMSTAAGIEVGKTQIKSRNVKVGVVTEITLSEEYDHIVIKAQMNKNAERMLNEETQFWVVKPRVGSEGISGLDTLLSGAYIQIQPGTSSRQKLEFTALELPPVAPLGSKGIRVVLSHQEAGKLNVGDPVAYQGFTVGRVEKTTFDLQNKKAQYQLFIFEPYDDLVLTGSQFWLNSGIDLNLNADGFNVRIDSLESLVSGGVTFGVPEGEPAGEPVNQSSINLPLFENYDQVREGLYSQYVKFIMVFDESIRGLRVGAPVEYRGIRIGTVLQAPYSKRLDPGETTSAKIPVLVKMELGRLFDKGNSISLDNFRDEILQQFDLGLRARIETGNLLTGSLYIDTFFDEPDSGYQYSQLDGYDVFPTRPGELAQVQHQVASLLNKFNNLPLNEAVGSLTRSLNTLDSTLLSADKAIRDLNKLIQQRDTQELPGEVKQSLQQIQTTLDGFSPDSTVYQDLEQAIQQFEQVMAELQPVLKKINEKPNSLVFGEDNIKDPVPVTR